MTATLRDARGRIMATPKRRRRLNECHTCGGSARLASHYQTGRHRAALRPKFAPLKPEPKYRACPQKTDADWLAEAADDYLARLAAVDSDGESGDDPDFSAWLAATGSGPLCGISEPAEHEPFTEPLGTSPVVKVARMPAPTSIIAPRAVLVAHRGQLEDCPRCHQEFRTPNGRAWHLANRPHCRAEVARKASAA